MKFVQAPLFPTKSDWKLPRELPRLKEAKIVGLDTETRDPQLLEKGPGVRRDGYMVGISCATPDGQSWYIPFGHAEGEQFEKEKVLQWARDNLCEPGQAKVGAHILYDLDYLAHENVPITGPHYDIQNAEPLIDENRRTYSLNSLAQRYLGETKEETLLESICLDWGLKGKPQKHLWRFGPEYTGKYAEADASQALRIFEKQKVILQQQDLERVFDIETRLIPMLLHMRRVGVRIDMDRLMKMHDHMTTQLKEEKAKLDYTAGCHVDYWANESVAKAFDNWGLSYPRSPKKNQPSFVKGWLERQNHDLPKQIVKCRTIDKFIGTFLEGSLLNMMVGDRIHCEFNQLRSDEKGTVTGRFSSSNPNLQFIPSRTEEGKRIRKMFIPEGGCLWYKADYSQIEIRVLVHYAALLNAPGAADIVAQFIKNPKSDYHQWCADTAGVSRTHAKTVNFGIVYGMGAAKLANDLGIELQEARDFMTDYFEVLPFIKKTVSIATNQAFEKGFIRTILGRRRRFDMWEPRDNRLHDMVKLDKDKKVVEEKVLKLCEMGNYRKGAQRAGCYKAFNAADQGSSADIMKMALVDTWESGVCDVITPHLTVHDEIDFSSPNTKEGKEAVKEVKDIFENTYKLKIPMICDVEEGPNWGAVKGINL